MKKNNTQENNLSTKNLRFNLLVNSTKLNFKKNGLLEKNNQSTADKNYKGNCFMKIGSKSFNLFPANTLDK